MSPVDQDDPHRAQKPDGRRRDPIKVRVERDPIEETYRLRERWAKRPKRPPPVEPHDWIWHEKQKALARMAAREAEHRAAVLAAEEAARRNSKKLVAETKRREAENLEQERRVNAEKAMRSYYRHREANLARMAAYRAKKRAGKPVTEHVLRSRKGWISRRAQAAAVVPGNEAAQREYDNHSSRKKRAPAHDSRRP